MIDVTQHGIAEANSGADNSDALVALYKATDPNRGNIFYFPPGWYQMAPIHAGLFSDSNETRYCSLQGAGIKSTRLINSDPTKPLFDFDGLDCFDQFFQDMTFFGGAPCVFRLTSGGSHYRVNFTRCWFRGGVDGLWINDGQQFELSDVTATHNSRYGVRLSGPYGVSASSLDVERNGTAGILIEKNVGSYRGSIDAVINRIYSEDNPALIVDGVNGITVHRMNGGATLRNGASDCMIWSSAQCESGARNNCLVDGQADGESGWLNYGGPLGGMFATVPEDPVPGSHIIFGESPDNFHEEYFTVEADKQYELKWHAQKAGGSAPARQQVTVQYQDASGEWHWFDFVSLSWVDTSKSVSLNADDVRRRYLAKFHTTGFLGGPYFRIRITKPPNEDASIAVDSVTLEEAG